MTKDPDISPGMDNGTCPDRSTDRSTDSDTNSLLEALADGLLALQSHVESQQPVLLDDPDISHQLASLGIDYLTLQALSLRLASDPTADAAPTLAQMLQLGARSLQQRQAQLAGELLGYYALVDEPVGSNEPSVVPSPVLAQLARAAHNFGGDQDDKVRQQLARYLQLIDTEPNETTP